MADPMQLISMRMPAELWQAAQARAEVEGTTVSDFVREALIKWTSEGDE